MRRDLVERDLVVEAERWIVEQGAEQPREIPLIGGHDVRKGAPDRPVRAGDREIELGVGERSAVTDEPLRRPHVVSKLSQHERDHAYASSARRLRIYVCRIGLPRFTNRPRPFLPRNLSFSTMTSPRESTVDAFPFTLRPS